RQCSDQDEVQNRDVELCEPDFHLQDRFSVVSASFNQTSQVVVPFTLPAADHKAGLAVTAADQVHQAQQVDALILTAFVQCPLALESLGRDLQQLVAESLELDSSDTRVESVLMCGVRDFKP